MSTPPSNPSPPGTILSPRTIRIASHVLMWLFLLSVMVFRLLPGLLCVCLGFFLTRWLARLLAMQKINSAQAWQNVPRWTKNIAAGIMIIAPLGLLGLVIAHSLDYMITTPRQYGDLLNYMASTVLELRKKLPKPLASLLPAESGSIERAVARYLAAQASSLAQTGRIWLLGITHAYVGLIIGALAAVGDKVTQPGVLVKHLLIRAHLFGATFRQIMAAQLWIALFNTVMLAIFLVFVLPLFGVQIPYTPALITLTMMAGLVPIVGNLVSNVVTTVVGLSVSPIAGAACLGFLILIHKAEYAINAKVVGHSTHIHIWELLAVMFVAEAIFGPAGLVAAPLFYAYLKKELQAVGLI